MCSVRLVSFMMENAEAIMTVPYRLCSQVRDLLGDIQREKVCYKFQSFIGYRS
jgi:hypothetical protein